MSPFEFGKWDTIFYNVEKAVFGSQFVFILLTILLILIFFRKAIIKFTKVDLLFLIYGIYLLFNLLIFTPINLNKIFVIENLLLGMLYICFRNLERKHFKYIIGIIVLAALHQIYFGIERQTAWFAPGYGFKDIKGSFINQGVFAVFIALAVLITVGFVLKSYLAYSIKKWLLKTVYIVFLALFTIVLFYSNSRAAWLACLFGLLFFLWKWYSLKLYFVRTKIRLVTSIVFVLLLVGIIFGLYHYKKDSADGRLLIWKVTLKMIKGKPILGHGINTFQSNYMQYQAGYFEENKDDTYQYLADNNNYAFNEFLRLGSEQGVLGILVFIVLGVLFINAKNQIDNKDYLDIISQSGLLLLIVFGLFSYPMEILQLKVVGILFIAILSGSSKKVKEFQFSRLTKVVIALPLLIVISFGFFKTYEIYKTYSQWNNALSKLKKGNYAEYTNFSKNHYQKLSYNGYFLGYYAKSLAKEKKYHKAIHQFKKAIKLIPSSDIYMDLGKSYKEIGNYKKAEEYWVTASNMVPSQFKPQYLIAKMYLENGQKEKAKQMASELLQKKVKVYSIEVHEILEELKRIVKDGDASNNNEF